MHICCSFNRKTNPFFRFETVNGATVCTIRLMCVYRVWMGAACRANDFVKTVHGRVVLSCKSIFITTDCQKGTVVGLVPGYKSILYYPVRCCWRFERGEKKQSDFCVLWVSIGIRVKCRLENVRTRACGCAHGVEEVQCGIN